MLPNNINPLADPIKEKYKLMVSQDNGLSYSPEYATDNRGDPELLRLIHVAQQDMLSYYVDGDQITSRQEAVKILANADDIWFRRGKDGEPDFAVKPDPNETWLQMDGYFTKKQLQAIIFLMENKE